MGFLKNRGLFIIAFLLAAIPVKAFARWPLAADQMPQSWESGCQAPLLIEIAGIKLSVPRHEIVLTLNSRQVKHADLESCDTHFIGDVHSVQWPHESLTDAQSFHDGPPTTYREFEREIDDAWRKGLADENLTDLKRISRPSSELYILFSRPTGNDEPIVFDCEGHQQDINKMSFLFCHVSYIYPAGIILSYSFDRRDHPDSKFLNLDQEKRGEIDMMIKAAHEVSKSK